MANNPRAADNLNPVTTSEEAAALGAKGGAAKKGKKHISTWIQELLEDEEFTAQIQEGYKIIDYKGAPIRAIVRAQAIKALNGDTKAFDVLNKYGWSPSKQEIDITSLGEQISQPVDSNLLTQFLMSAQTNTKR